MPNTILAFDYGSKKIGVANGQDLTRSASPLTTIMVNKSDRWGEIDKLVKEWRPSIMVVGLPLHMDGTEQPFTDEARNFANELGERYGCRIELMDERLTSYEAEQLLKSQDSHKQSRQTPQDVDKIAAQLILESWFNQNMQD